MAAAKPTIPDLQKLVSDLIFPFYQVERHGELSFASGRHENDAEHSWSLGLFACALAPQVDPQLDVGKVAQFATVHDVAEIYAGDTSNFAPATELSTKESREKAALDRIVDEFSPTPWIGETLVAYERQDCDEARFVKSLDKVLVLLYDYVEKGYFYQRNKITREHWEATMQKHRKKAAVHDGAFRYYDEIWRRLLASPKFFYEEK